MESSSPNDRQRPSAVMIDKTNQQMGQKQFFDNDGSPVKTGASNGGGSVIQHSAQVQQEGGFVRMFEPNWWEFRLKSKQPERRGYHSSFIHNKKLYVYGGKDIGLGHMNNLWMMDINGLDSFKQGETEYEINPEWQLVETSGMVNSVKPPPISHHTSTVYGDKMFLFGGSSKNAENLNLYSLDLIKYQWQIIKAKPSGGKEDNLPHTRDEHTCLVYQDSMIVFGGFAFGERTNSIFKYSFKQNSWEKIPHKGSNAPCPRAGHSAVIRLDGQGDHMVIFGGKDDENQKLSDTWKFNMTSCEWSKIEVPGEEPLPRSGHASQIYNDFMIIYGGIYEVTKELNDMHVFDLKNERWLCLFQELNSPQKQPPSSNALGNSPNSVGLKKSMTMKGMTGTMNDTASPRKEQKLKTSKKPKITLTPIGANKVDERQIKLESPTSITMKNSFLIKNADPSFEKCYAQIRKRALDREKQGGSPSGYDESMTKSSGKRPQARDGHTGIVLGHSFFVFGGDRHHMPFNDFHMLDLDSEFQAKSFIF